MSLSKRQLALRADAIGASEIAALAGLSRWATPIEIFEAKVTDHQKEVSLAMELGTEFEEPIAKIYGRRSGKWLKRVDTLKSERYPLAIATPDRAVFPVKVKELVDKKLLGMADLGACEYLAQIKHTNWRQAKDFGEPGTDQVTDAFLAAGMWEMGVTGVRRLDYVILFDKDRLDTWTLFFNEDLFHDLYALASRFMVDHVWKRVPPPVEPTEAYADFLDRWFPGIPAAAGKKKRPEQLVVATEEVAEQVRLFARLKAAEKRLKKMLDGASNWINLQIGNADGLTHSSFGKVTWKRTKDPVKTDWEAVAVESQAIAALAISGELSEEGALELTNQLKTVVAKHTVPKPGYRRPYYKWEGAADLSTTPIDLALPVPETPPEAELDAEEQ